MPKVRWMSGPRMMNAIRSSSSTALRAVRTTSGDAPQIAIALRRVRVSSAAASPGATTDAAVASLGGRASSGAAMMPAVSCSRPAST